MPLTPEDVRNKQFTTVRLKEGYDEEEVDAFLDEVEAELTRLLRENDELRAQLAAAESRGGRVVAAPVAPPPPPPSIPAPSAPAVGREAPSDAAARLLQLAQRTADEAVTEARMQSDKILGEARQKADQIVGEARGRADRLEREAQERQRQTLGALEQQRSELERKIDNLRAFEREYRSRLKSYLENQLRQLEGHGDDSGAAGAGPAVQAAASAVRPGGFGGGLGQRGEGAGESPFRGQIIDEGDH